MGGGKLYKSDALAAVFDLHTPDIFGTHHPGHHNGFHPLAPKDS